MCRCADREVKKAAEVIIDLVNQLAKSAEAFRDLVRDWCKDEYSCSQERRKMMTDLNYREEPLCVSGDIEPETAKSILENMDAILKELSNELRRIDSAIYSPQNYEDASDLNEKKESLLETLNRQRNDAEGLLKLAVHIREGLW